jgi:hypothetical protein
MAPAVRRTVRRLFLVLGSDRKCLPPLRVRVRRGYLRLAAQDRMSDAELDEALAELQKTRATAEGELETLSSRQEEIEELERDRDALMASWTAAVPSDLDRLTPEGRNELYHKLRLEISPTEDGYEVTGPFCTFEPSPSSSTFRNYTHSEPRFRALLIGKPSDVQLALS